MSVILFLIAAGAACVNAEPCNNFGADCPLNDTMPEVVFLQTSQHIMDPSSGVGMLATSRNSSEELGASLAARRVKVLVLLVSCHKHASSWSRLRQWGEGVHPGGRVLILAGIPTGMTGLAEQYQLSLSNATLFVNASDVYEGLPEKMIRAFHAVNDAADLQDITHVFKLDDTGIVADPLALGYSFDKSWGCGIFNYWNRVDVKSMEVALEMQPADYLADVTGKRILDCIETQCSFDYHLTKELPNTSYWADKVYVLEGVKFAFADGSRGYMMSRKALGVLAEQYPLETMLEFSHTHVLEDVAVGLGLHKGGIEVLAELPVGVPSCSCPDVSYLTGNQDTYDNPEAECLRCCLTCEQARDIVNFTHDSLCSGVQTTTR